MTGSCNGCRYLEQRNTDYGFVVWICHLSKKMVGYETDIVLVDPPGCRFYAPPSVWPMGMVA